MYQELFYNNWTVQPNMIYRKVRKHETEAQSQMNKKNIVL